MKALRTLERKLIPNLRTNKYYKISRAIILLPIAIPIYYVNEFIRYVRQLGFKRKGKPDVVFSNIVAGWYNLAFTDPSIEVVARKRAAICANCPLAVLSSSFTTRLIDNKTTAIRGLSCEACGCNLSAKVRSIGDQCPLSKW